MWLCILMQFQVKMSSTANQMSNLQLYYLVSHFPPASSNENFLAEYFTRKSREMLSHSTFKTKDRELIKPWIDLSTAMSSTMLTPPISFQCRKDTFDARAISWQLQ